MRSYLLKAINVIQAVFICLFSFYSIFSFANNGKELDFDKLFSEKTNNKNILEKKYISEEEKEKARRETSNIATPMTLIGKGAKAIYVCEDCSSNHGSYISVEFEGICGLAPCTESNLRIWGGNGQFVPSFDKASSGAIHKGANGLNGTYQWQATLDDKYVCSGTFTIKDYKQWLNLYAYSKCSSSYYKYF